ncbi:phospholipase D family protein [Aquipuribacter nitratireducens]|uniref:Phospholipase D family protein n=1 Tax=Aquipuribacter nitratireducens TaxID=650104 RepID=A0ABW0GMM4_9MICO
MGGDGEAGDGEVGDGATDWFLDADGRGNPASRLRPWTSGNRVEPLVHGRTYFPRLADTLAGVGPGDLVLVAGWRGDPDELLTDDGPTVGEALSAAARRGATVRGLLWHSHLDAFRLTHEENRGLALSVEDAGGRVLLDQRVRPFGCHHQKFVVVRHAGRPERDVAYAGGLDLGHGRRDDDLHHGDPQTRRFADVYGPTPAWHDVQVAVCGPAVADVEDSFRERWEDDSPVSLLLWHVVPDLVHGVDRRADPLPPPRPAPAPHGSCAVQVLRTYPRRHVRHHPFAPSGERSVARAYLRALRRARRLVYVEDQYLWSTEVAKVFADALRDNPRLQLVAVVPRHSENGGAGDLPMSVGHARALRRVKDAGGRRVVVVDLENDRGLPVYVHAKVCVVDDVWACVGSDNFNRRSWTYDAELTVAVLDAARDERVPADPAGLGDGARVFARGLRLRLMAEHLGLTDADGRLEHPAAADHLLDPDAAVHAVRACAEEVDRWHGRGRRGPRPHGRLRSHPWERPRAWQVALGAPAYHLTVDPDGRPRALRRRGGY